MVIYERSHRLYHPASLHQMVVGAATRRTEANLATQVILTPVIWMRNAPGGIKLRVVNVLAPSGVSVGFAPQQGSCDRSRARDNSVEDVP